MCVDVGHCGVRFENHGKLMKNADTPRSFNQNLTLRKYKESYLPFRDEEKPQNPTPDLLLFVVQSSIRSLSMEEHHLSE